MSARRRGLVRRGPSWWQWDGSRYVRVFAGSRVFWLCALDSMTIGTARESAFFQPFEDGSIDAPEWIPAGAMWGNEFGGVGSVMRLRGGV